MSEADQIKTNKIQHIRANLDTRTYWGFDAYREFYDRDVVGTLLPEVDRLQAEIKELRSQVDILRRGGC